MARERRVLLIEDDQDTADSYLRQLRRDGVPIEQVRTPKEADEFARSRPPVLVLIDLGLPGSGGRELVEGWSADPTLGAIPVWIVTNAVPEDNLWWHNATNVQRYFLKSRVVPARLSLEIRATLGLPYGDRLTTRLAS